MIPKLLEQWKNSYHVVYGVRVKRKETLFRQLAYKAFYRVFRRLAAFEVPVDAGDFGLLDRTAVNVLLNDFPERLVFLRGLRAYTGLRHTGVDYVRDERFDGRSTNSLRGNLRWAKLAIFSFSHKPLEYISILAFGFLFLSISGLLFYTGAYFLSMFSDIEAPPKGFMTQLLLLIFVASIQLFGLSVIAEYLAHIYEEVKGRPRYIVRDTVDNRDRDTGNTGDDTS